MHEIHFVCSFFSAARRTNKEALPRLSGFWLVATVAVGVCGTRFAQTVLALFPLSSLRLCRPIKAELTSPFSGFIQLSFFNPLVLRTPPLYSLTETQGRRVRFNIFALLSFQPPRPTGTPPIFPYGNTP